MSLGKNLIHHIGSSVPLQLYQMLFRRRVIGAYYHVASDEPLGHVEHVHPYKSASQFERDLLHLKSNFNLVSYDQVSEHAGNRVDLPRKSLFLSIDDGYAECYTIMRPLLLKHGIPCTFFLATDFVDNKTAYYKNVISLCIGMMRKINPAAQQHAIHNINQTVGRSIDNVSTFEIWMKGLTSRDERILSEVSRILNVDVNEFLRESRPYLTTEQVRQLAADGFTIGAHGRRHARLDLEENEDAVRDEIIGSCNAIRDLTSQEEVPFAFPHSGAGLDRVFLTILAAEFGFVGLMFDTEGVRKDGPRVLHRVCLDGHDTPVHRHSNTQQQIRDAYEIQASKNLASIAHALIGSRA